MKAKNLMFLIMGIAMVFTGGMIWVGVGKPTREKRHENADEFKLTARSFYMDPYVLHQSLEVLIHEYLNEQPDEGDVSKILTVMVRELEGSERYYECIPYLNIEKKGVLYGAVAQENPIGGGYANCYHTGKYVVRNADQLVEAVGKAREGDVIFVPGDVKIDMTEFMFTDQYVIKLKDGVILASDRGRNGSLGGMIYTTAIRAVPFIQAGENARISGICLQGPDAKERDWKNRFMMSGILIDQLGVVVDNCEISGFNYAAIEISGVEDAIIRCNYIHDNKSVNKGYGICVDGAGAVVEYNWFNNNRTCIKGIRKPACRIEINHNIDMGNTLEHFLKLETSKSRGTVQVQDYVKVSGNTILSDSHPFQIDVFPQERLEILNNFFYKQAKEYPNDSGLRDDQNAFGLREMVQTQKETEERSILTVARYASKHKPEMRLANITSRIFYCDLSQIHDLMVQLINRIDNQKILKDEIKLSMQDMIRAIENYDRAYEYLEQPYITVDSEEYGAVPDRQPLGGGYEYKEIFTTGDYVVETTEEFINALSKAQEGETIFVKGDAVIDLTVRGETLTIKKGVTLAGDRGNGNSPGALIYCDSFYAPVFDVKENVRITGICIKGPDPEPRLDFHKRCFAGENAKGHDYYFKLVTMYGLLTNYSGLQVDNCELAGFSTGAISISGESTDHYIHHNYIHHNQRNGLGYGVSHGKAVSLIEYNLFNYNRHDIQGSGQPGSGYEARFNLQMGHSLSHCFDMHGGSDRGDGTSVAGENILIHHNTFLSEQYPYWVRGLPTGIQDFYRNVVYLPLKAYDKDRLFGWNSDYYEKFIVRDNVFDLKNKPVKVP